MAVLLDSVILIDHLNGIPAATLYLREVEGAHISAITRAEVLAGTHPSALSLTKRLLNRYPLLTIDTEAADLAAEFRRNQGWRLPDAFQAALAQIHGLQLATRNTKDFSPVKHSWVIVPYRLSH